MQDSGAQKHHFHTVIFKYFKASLSPPVFAAVSIMIVFLPTGAIVLETIKCILFVSWSVLAFGAAPGDMRADSHRGSVKGALPVGVKRGSWQGTSQKPS